MSDRHRQIVSDILVAIWATPIEDRPVAWRDPWVYGSLPARLEDLAPYIEAEIQKERDRADRLEAELRGAQIVNEKVLTANGEMAESLRWILGCAEAGDLPLEQVLTAARAGLFGKPARAARLDKFTASTMESGKGAPP